MATRKITLQALRISQFKGVDSLELRLDGRSASIYGDNGAGKTTIFDAWSWLLTGRDSHGQMAFDVKPLNPDGTIRDRSARSTVEATLLADDGDGLPLPVTLRREYYERWTERRGSSERVYDGNATDFYIDGVPKSKREYDAFLDGLCPSKLLTLLSDGAAFAALKWQDRRGILFELAGIASDADILAMDERFADLAADLGRLSPEDYAAKGKAERKQLNTQRGRIPDRMDELRRMEEQLAGINFAAARAEVSALEEQLAGLRAERAALTSGDVSAARAKVDAIRNQIDRLDLDNQRHRAAQTDGDPCEALRGQITQLKLSHSYAAERLRGQERDVDRYNAQADDARSRWLAVRRETYTGTDTCPTCGQPLPPEQAKAARKKWADDQDRRLTSIAEEGSRYAKLAKRATEQAEESKATVSEYAAQLKQAQEMLDQAEQSRTEVTDLEGYADQRADLTRQLYDAESALKSATDDAGRASTAIKARMAPLEDKLRKAQETAAQEATLRSVRQRRAALEQEARDLSARLAQCDRMLDLCDDFTRFKVNYISGQINQYFRLARFRLFAEQVNGGLAACCDITVGGVPYNSANSAARVNVGLDIIRALSEHYGVRLPVFVDGAESVVRLDAPEDYQIIRLTVSGEDKRVRVAV